VGEYEFTVGVGIIIGRGRGRKHALLVNTVFEMVLTARSTLRNYSRRRAKGRGKGRSIGRRMGELVAGTRVEWILLLGEKTQLKRAQGFGL